MPKSTEELFVPFTPKNERAHFKSMLSNNKAPVCQKLLSRKQFQRLQHVNKLFQIIMSCSLIESYFYSFIIISQQFDQREKSSFIIKLSCSIQTLISCIWQRTVIKRIICCHYQGLTKNIDWLFKRFIGLKYQNFTDKKTLYFTRERHTVPWTIVSLQLPILTIYQSNI